MVLVFRAIAEGRVHSPRATEPKGQQNGGKIYFKFKNVFFFVLKKLN
jgi:hypothetical protein